MTLVEEYHAAHKARLARMNGPTKEKPPAPEEVVVPEPEPFKLKPVWFSIEESPPPPTILVEDISKAVCRHFNITSTAIKGTRRTHDIVYPRQIAMFLARRHTTRSLPDIGRRFGRKDHTTVLHGARKIDRACLSDWLVAYDVAHIEATL